MSIHVANVGGAYKEILIALKGGLNTASDPSIIDTDQLVQAAGIEYRPPRVGVFATPGRSQFGTFSATAGSTKTHALCYTQFDGTIYAAYSATAVPASGGYLIALSGSSAFYASSSSSPTWSKLASGFSVASSTSFGDSVSYNNELFIWNGGEVPKVWRVAQASQLPATFLEPHGMIAVTASAAVAATAVGGASIPAGSYQVWFTELYSVDSALGTFRESSYNGNPSDITLSATGLGISVTFPATVNSPVDNHITYCGIAGQKYPFGYRQLSNGVGAANVTITALATGGAGNLVGPLFPYPIVGPIGGVPVSSNDRPPKTLTARIFEDSIVAIDADNRQLLRYSLIDDVHYFPSINYIPFETPWADHLVALQNCNNSLLVFGEFYGFRVDYLPRHTDSEDIESARGRSKTKFIEGHGAVSPRGVGAFSLPTGGEIALFVCRDGIHLTDGEAIEDATKHIDWATTVSVSDLPRCVLKNNPKRFRIEFYYLDQSSNPKRLDLYYHPDFLRPGKVLPIPTILGPTPVPGLAPAIGILSSDWQMWNGSETTPATVWLEATGTTDNAALENADGRITHNWQTRDFYFAGMDGEYELYKVYTHQSQTTASGSYTITAEGRTDDIGITFIATSTVNQNLSGGQQHPALHSRAQRFSVRGEKSDGGAWQELNYLVFVVKGAQELQSASKP